MHRTTRLPVSEINQHFVCVICDGYIVDATTIVECLHSFCRTCIVRFLETSEFCPVCDVQVHKTKPLQSIRSDTTLQDVIYKLIPGLYQNEMLRRREFYAEHPEAATLCSSEERGEGADQRCFYSPQESISLSLEYFKGSDCSADSESSSETPDKDVMTRYLKCPAAMTVAHLKKFIRMKFSLPLTYTIKIMYLDNLLGDDYTLIDIAYIYSWRRAGPMKFLYTFTHRKHVAQSQALPAIAEATVKSESQNESQTVEPVKNDDKTVSVDVKTEEDEKMDTAEVEVATVKSEPLVEPKTIVETTTSPVDSTEVTASVKSEETHAVKTVEQSTSSPTTPTDSISNFVINAFPPNLVPAAQNQPNPNLVPAAQNQPNPNLVPAAQNQPKPNLVPAASNQPKPNPLPQSSSISSPQPVPQFVSQSQGGGNLKLKLINVKESISKTPKSSSGKKVGRKPGRSRNTPAPVTQRFKKLAPYPPPQQQLVHQTATVNPLAIRKFVPAGVMNTMAQNVMLSFVPTTATAGLCSINNVATSNSPATGLCSISNNMVTSNPTGKPSAASFCNINNVTNSSPVASAGIANSNMVNTNPVTTVLCSVNNSVANNISTNSLCNINVSNSNSMATASINHSMVNSKPPTSFYNNNIGVNNPVVTTSMHGMNVNVSSSSTAVSASSSSITNTNIVVSKPEDKPLYKISNVAVSNSGTSGVCSIKTVAPSMPIILPSAGPTMVNGQQDNGLKTPTLPKPQDKIPESPSSAQVVNATEVVAPRPAFYPPPSQQQTATTVCSIPHTPLGPLVSPGNNSKPIAALVPTRSAPSPIAKTTDKPASPSESKTEIKSNCVSRPTTPSLLMAALCDDKIGKKNVTIETKAELNGKRSTHSPSSATPSLKRSACSPSLSTPPAKRNAPSSAVTPPPSKELHFSSPEKKSAFEQSVKNSISAEFSDNDDLGCQPDLVVDEQKMEENADSSDEDEESALRKKITAIAEEKEDEDSGRASDISSQARSSCDDDVGSPSVPTAMLSQGATSPSLPNFSLASSSSGATSTSNRATKSNNINHVINNLLMRNHERKDSMGALDLSTCTKPAGPSRPKPVANPVLDIKHRQQTYLPAPGTNTNNNNSSNSTTPVGNSNSKQHTACVPSPKHPILMHGLASTLSPLQLSALRGKSPHLPVPPFHGTAMVYPSQGNRTSPATGRSPTYNQTVLLSGMIPRMSSYPVVPNTPMRTYGGMNHNNNTSVKGSSSPNSPSATNNAKSPNHPKSNNSNNHSKTPSSSNSRTYSSHLKGLASQPQNPYSKGSSNKSQSPVSSYKKSNSNFPVYSPTKKQQPPPTPSYKSYNTKFKSTGNLAVINPDPNGSLHKLVIRNLDARPTSPQSQKL
ncbi:hypothetical protein JTE90_004190 [Oedothorax gibbosus]|uniref:RING-type domain-containing protein n=1 Tax=Oedothorax gibbosus TaxID=931172 RepID=A0AAV6UPL9_9ARAC|nr:hypothetical protein JTE90_004190 [Oedothorax gibbosus]